MRVLPAIDLRAGRVVRLRQGDVARETVFADDPVAVASAWMAAGATEIHAVDLDGAMAGEPRQLAVLARLAALPVVVQWGGGLRSEDAVEAALATGAGRVVMGSALVSDETLRLSVGARFGERIVAAIDSRDDEVRVGGWTGSSGASPERVARDCAAAGLTRALVTDVARDGELSGPNLALCAVVRGAGLPDVIVSGGVASVDDVRRARAAGFWGIVLGMALYRGNVALEEALAAAS